MAGRTAASTSQPSADEDRKAFEAACARHDRKRREIERSRGWITAGEVLDKDPKLAEGLKTRAEAEELHTQTAPSHSDTYQTLSDSQDTLDSGRGRRRGRPTSEREPWGVPEGGKDLLEAFLFGSLEAELRDGIAHAKRRVEKREHPTDWQTAAFHLIWYVRLHPELKALDRYEALDRVDRVICCLWPRLADLEDEDRWIEVLGVLDSAEGECDPISNFLSAWDQVKYPRQGNLLKAACELAEELPVTPPRKLDRSKVRALASVCWHLFVSKEEAGDGEFCLSVRQAAWAIENLTGREVSPRTAATYLQELERAGFLLVVSKTRPGPGGKASRYTIDLERTVAAEDLVSA